MAVVKNPIANGNSVLQDVSNASSVALMFFFSVNSNITLSVLIEMVLPTDAEAYLSLSL